MSRIKDESVTSLALGWRIERPDGGGLALTSHDAPVEIDEMVFHPSPGMVPASVTHRSDLQPTATEVAGALSSNALSERDLAGGRWDGARVSLIAFDWREPLAAPVEIASGELGAVTTQGNGFSAELAGAAARLTEPVCPSTSSQCRAELGDKACRIDLAGRTVRRVTTAWNGAELSIDSAIDEGFLFGRLRYLSGGNCGLESIVLGVAGAVVRLRDLPRFDVEPGTSVEIREGCDKRLETCAARFGNAANFRGEPHLPGTDLLTRYPGA